MKKIICILLPVVLSVLFTACTEEVTYNQEAYKSVVHLQTSGMVDLKFYNIGQDISYNTQILKGGTNPASTGAVDVTAFTAEEMEIYNEEHGTAYLLLPEDCYTLTDDIFFDAKRKAFPLEIVLKQQTGSLIGDYVLPVRIKSEKHSVHDYGSTLILKLEIIAPSVSLEHKGLHKITMEVGAEPQTFNTTLLFDYFNVWNFTVNLNTDRTEQQILVDQYNTDNSSAGITYDLLPTANYTLPASVEFTDDSSSEELLVIMNNTSLPEGDYLLPIQLQDVVGKPFNVDKQVLYLHLEYRDVLKLITVTSAMLTSNGTTPQYAFDAVGFTLWTSPTGSATSHPTYGQYMDINLGAAQSISKRVRFDLRTKWSDQKPHTVQLFGGTSAGDLEPLGTAIVMGGELILPTRENCMIKDNDAAAASGKRVIYEGTDIALDKTITYLRFCVLKTFDGAGAPWSAPMTVHDQTANPTTHTMSISELLFYGI